MPAEEVEVFQSAAAPNLEKIAPHARQLLEAQLLRRAGKESDALALARRRFDGPLNPFYLEYQLGLLAEWGAGADAQMMLEAQGKYLGEFELRLTQARVAQLAGDPVLARASLHAALRLPLDSRRVERLVTSLIAQPERESFRELASRVTDDPSLLAMADGASFWLAANLCGEAAAGDEWRNRGHQVLPGTAYPDITGLDFGNWDPLAAAAPIRLVNVVTFPREVILALLGRMQPQRSRTAAANNRR
jgi:hypothetical protein